MAQSHHLNESGSREWNLDYRLNQTINSIYSFISSSILESSKQRIKRLQQEVSHSNSKRISRIESVIPCFVLTALPLSLSIRILEFYCLFSIEQEKKGFIAPSIPACSFEKGEVLFRVPYPKKHFAFWRSIVQYSIVYPFLGVRYHIKFTRASFLSFCWQPLSMYV